MLQGPALALQRLPKAAPLTLVAGLFGLVSGCTGEGVGQLEGTLFLRYCPAQDPTAVGSKEVPNPLPSFALNPVFFAGEATRQWRGGSRYEPADFYSLRIRMQRGAEKPERADVFQIYLANMDVARAEHDAAVARGEPGLKIVPPPVDQPVQPLPGDPENIARASLELHASCRNRYIQPQFSGYVHFNALGREPGEWVDGEVSLSISDARAIREQGPMPASVDVAGALTGSFRFQLRLGPAVPSI